MEEAADIVIIGAGISGLATALGLHRLGIRSLVLEASERLRVTGFAFLTWTNAWKALDALGVGDSLRRKHTKLHSVVAASISTGVTTARSSFDARGKCGEHEVRCVKRIELLETLEQELPDGTIRFNSKVVSIEHLHNFQIVHLADGSTVKSKVAIGCDGVNSVVAELLGLQKAAFVGRSAVRGLTDFPNGHSLKPEFLQYFGDGIRFGFMPCDHKTVYWFCTYFPSQMKGREEEPLEMKQYVLNNLGKVPEEIREIVEKGALDTLISSPLRFRWPWNLLRQNLSKGGISIAGDALHPMTPDIGQGGCSALEDGVVLARCLGEALLGAPKEDGRDIGDEHERIEKGLEKYAKERRWRSFNLVTTAYVIGLIQQSDGKVMNFVRDKCLSSVMAGILLKRADFDCGKLC